MKKGKPEPEDWITFLSCNVNTNVNLTAVLFSAVIMVSVLIIQLSITGHLNIMISSPFFILGGAALWQFFRGSRASRKYQRLMHRIMIGELTTHEEILEEYKPISVFFKEPWVK